MSTVNMNGANSWGMFANGYQGKQVWLDYMADVQKAKSYVRAGVSANGTLTMSVDGGSFTYATLPTYGTAAGAIGGIHSANANQIRGLKFKSVDITDGVLVDVLIPAANKLAGAATVEGIFVQNAVRAANICNEQFAAAAEGAAREIDAAGKLGAAAGYSRTVGTNSQVFVASANADASYDSDDVLAYVNTSKDTIIKSITDLKGQYNTLNKKFGLKADVMLVDSKVYSELQMANILLFKPITLVGGETVEVASFLDMTIIECPDLSTFRVIMYNHDALYQAKNLNFIVENENDPAVPGGLSIKGEIGVSEGMTDFGAYYDAYAVLGLKDVVSD